MQPYVKAIGAAGLLLAPCLARADYRFHENFDRYNTGNLNGQTAWAASSESSIVLTGAALSGTAGIYGVGTAPADSSSSSNYALGATLLSGGCNGVTTE